LVAISGVGRPLMRARRTAGAENPIALASLVSLPNSATARAIASWGISMSHTKVRCAPVEDCETFRVVGKKFIFSLKIALQKTKYAFYDE